MKNSKNNAKVLLKQPKVIMNRKIRVGQDDGSFDREFWKRVGPEGRLIAAWEMVQETNLIQGKRADKSRLQRSIQSISRTIFF